MKIWQLSASDLLRGVSAVALAGAVVLGLGSGTASASFLVDFNADPVTDVPIFASVQTSFDSGGFLFTFETEGDGGSFNIADDLGDAGTDGIEALSTGAPDLTTTESITIVLSGGGTFFFGSIFIDSVGPDMLLEGILGGTVEYFTTVDGTNDGGQLSGDSAQSVDTVRLRSTDFNQLRFDNFAGELAPVIPLPAALPLFASGLAMLGIAGWRRKRKAAA